LKIDTKNHEFEIPKKGGETEVTCNNFKAFGESGSGNYLLNCKYSSGSTFIYAFVARIEEDSITKGIYWDKPTEANIPVFPKHTVEAEELDSNYVLNVNLAVSQAIAYDTFLNQDLFAGSGVTTAKTGFWVYETTKPDKVYEFKSKRFISFTSLKALATNKMDDKFRLLYAGWGGEGS
jgi:hypothetical protein